MVCIVEGCVVKDGFQFIVVNGNKFVWFEGVLVSEGFKVVDINGFYQFFDIFEKLVGVKVVEKIKVDVNWIVILLFEEEQMEKFKDDVDEWSIVQSKFVKVKKNKQVLFVLFGDEQILVLIKDSQKFVVQLVRFVFVFVFKIIFGVLKNFGFFFVLFFKDELIEEVEEEWDVQVLVFRCFEVVICVYCDSIVDIFIVIVIFFYVGLEGIFFIFLCYLFFFVYWIGVNCFYIIKSGFLWWN